MTAGKEPARELTKHPGTGLFLARRKAAKVIVYINLGVPALKGGGSCGDLHLEMRRKE